MICKHFSLIYKLLFHFVDGFFAVHSVLSIVTDKNSSLHNEHLSFRTLHRSNMPPSTTATSAVHSPRNTHRMASTKMENLA